MFYDFGGSETDHPNRHPSSSSNTTSGVFDNAGNMLDEQGAVLLPNQVVEQIFRDWSSSAPPPPPTTTTISPGPMGYYPGTPGALATRDEQAMESWQPVARSPSRAAPHSSHCSTGGLQPHQACAMGHAHPPPPHHHAEQEEDDDDDDDDAVDADVAADNAPTTAMISDSNNYNNHHHHRHQSGSTIEAARRASASFSSPFRISPDHQQVEGDASSLIRTGTHIDRRGQRQQQQQRVHRGGDHQHQHPHHPPQQQQPYYLQQQQQQQRSGSGVAVVVVAQPAAYADPPAPATRHTHTGPAASREPPHQSPSRAASNAAQAHEAASGEAAAESVSGRQVVVLPQDNLPARAFDTSSSSSSPYPPADHLHAADAWFEQHPARLRLQHQHQQLQQLQHQHLQHHQLHHSQRHHRQQYACAPPSDAAFEFSPLSSPLRPRTQPTPTIIVPSDHSSYPFFPLQPEDVHHSATSVSSTSSLPFQDPSYPARYHPHHHRRPTTPLVIDSSHLSPIAPFMPSLEQQEMQTPPRSPHDHHNHMDVNGLHLVRKRSHSVMSGGERATHEDLTHRRSLSMEGMEGTSPHGDDFSPRSRTLKRDDPPLNQQGKYFCNFDPECEGQTFDRKCEWNKHMDKHDRPYRCADPACAKLQGFTYSGGLLRHEREVHGKHGGPKAQLMCPYPNCKRHSGKGFTRKENLNEHVRRVHESRNQASPGGMPLKRDGPVIDAALLGPDPSETPLSRLSETLVSDDVISPALKRRRGLLPGQSDGSGGGEDIDELHQEVLRLRAENAEKDARLMHMEQKMEEADRRREEEMNQMHALHEEMRQLRQAQQLQQVLGSVTGADPKVSV